MWFIVLSAALVAGLILISWVLSGGEHMEFGKTPTNELDPTVEFGDSKRVPEDD